MINYRKSAEFNPGLNDGTSGRVPNVYCFHRKAISMQLIIIIIYVEFISICSRHVPRQ